MDNSLYTLHRFGGYSLRTETPFAPAPVVEVWRDNEVIAKLRLPMTPTDFAVGANGIAICLGDGEGKRAVTWTNWQEAADADKWHYRQLAEPIVSPMVTATALGVVAALNTRAGALILWAGGYSTQKAWWALTAHNRALIVATEKEIGISHPPFATVKPVVSNVEDWAPSSKWIKLDGKWLDATELIG
jgi:hypothetical protein